MLRPSAVLTINAGSTSMKTTVLERTGVGWHRLHTYTSLSDALDGATAGGREVPVVLHRVVHGGSRRTPVVVDDAVLAELGKFIELAPLHQPPALDALRLARAALPRARHVACFDTAFHHTIPAAASTYALPARLRRRVRVFGFHGLSHAWASGQVRARRPHVRRIVVAHLGGGASLCAVLDGRSTATTMGFTPLDGLVMATRGGSIDPGALLFLATTTDEDLQHVLGHESGLLGLCGTSSLREVWQRADRQDADAVLAREVYVHRLVTSIAAMAAAMDGVDVLVFTGGVGEHSARLRAVVAERLAWLGGAGGPDLLVVPAEEDLQMVADARDLIDGVTAVGTG